jgi:hypothetical protein
MKAYLSKITNHSAAGERIRKQNNIQRQICFWRQVPKK